MTLSSSVRDSLEAATAQYELFVTEASTYLEQRGIDLALASTHRLGVVSVPVVGHEMFQDRLCIPYLTKAGVVNLKFRCMGDHDCKDQGHAKYLVGGDRTNIYNVGAFFKDTPIIAITEGEFDAVILDGIVGIPAVGVPGVRNWKPHYSRCFVDYEHVFVFADGDESGKDFGSRVSSLVDGTTIVTMPHGTDVNTVYLSEGADGLRKRAGL